MEEMGGVEGVMLAVEEEVEKDPGRWGWGGWRKWKRK